MTIQATIICPSKAESTITGFLAAYELLYASGAFKVEFHANAPHLRYFYKGQAREWAKLPMHCQKAAHKAVAVLKTVYQQVKEA